MKVYRVILKGRVVAVITEGWLKGETPAQTRKRAEAAQRRHLGSTIEVRDL